LLEAEGYVVHGIDLASVKGPAYVESFTPDVKIIAAKIHDVLSAGRDLIMVFHSYGGVPGSEALSTHLTRSPTHGEIIHLFYLTAFILPAPSSLFNALDNGPAPWQIVSSSGTQVKVVNPREIFYNDVEAALAEELVAALRPHAYRALLSKVTCEPWREVAWTYVLCTLDNAIPLTAQEAMVARAQELAPGSLARVERLEAGHSPFVSQPERVAEILMRGGEVGKRGRGDVKG